MAVRYGFELQFSAPNGAPVIVEHNVIDNITDIQRHREEVCDCHEAKSKVAPMPRFPRIPSQEGTTRLTDSADSALVTHSDDHHLSFPGVDDHVARAWPMNGSDALISPLNRECLSQMKRYIGNVVTSNCLETLFSGAPAFASEIVPRG